MTARDDIRSAGARTVVLFDLDGTLSDSAPGILTSLRHAFAVNGLPALDPVAEQSLLGPPFYESLPPITGEDLLWPVIESYRARYTEAMYEATVFPGVVELLDALRADGRRLAVATSKPELYAVPIVEHLGLLDHFETVGGDEADGSLPTKALVIEKVLARLGRPDPAEVIMIGDRSHDVIGAREHGIDTIGVNWGYGLPGELESAQSGFVCDTPADVAAVLGVDFGVRAG
jgi:phosphoglycolate phosphatase